ncbi:hypothetical protein [Carboxylicivirga linearis]|uniref:DUF5673 domain-containing protein n=1 Tax=Carboxylicivirga linearis TaxID=1628157 RepID=A0ABS5K1L4_9BACT|nr:hypothetical protein [Carboxylicivirga linearis]MBS2101024.1 hypothetical protein [Carboxylicivirga linearis]
MNTFILLLTFIILTILIIRLLLFIKFKNDLKKGKIKVFKLKEYTPFAWINVFGIFISIFFAIVFYKIQESYVYLIVWSAIGLTNLINIFIAPQNYILADKKGIKKSYIGRKHSWNKISIKQSDTNLNIFNGRKSMTFKFRTKDDLEHFTEIAQSTFKQKI